MQENHLPTIREFGEIQQLALAGAAIIRDLLAARPDATLGLATGRTPLALYSALIAMFRRHEISFSRVTTFNLDEYCGEAPDSTRSFTRYMYENFFNHVDIDKSRIHFPECSPGESDGFDKRIIAAGGIDLQLLGIGVNGHIAFNEPGSGFCSRTRITRLSESTIEENFPGYGPDDNDLIPTRAATMGVGTILEARRILLLATGRRKSSAIQQALEGPISESCPASAIRMHHNVTVLIDKEAGSQLGGAIA